MLTNPDTPIKRKDALHECRMLSADLAAIWCKVGQINQQLQLQGVDKDLTDQLTDIEKRVNFAMIYRLENVESYLSYWYRYPYGLPDTPPNRRPYSHG